MKELLQAAIPDSVEKSAKNALNIVNIARNLVSSVVSSPNTGATEEVAPIHHLTLPVDTEINNELSSPEELAKELTNFAADNASGTPGATYMITSRINLPEGGLPVLADEIQKESMLTKGAPVFKAIEIDGVVCPIRLRATAISTYVENAQ